MDKMCCIPGCKNNVPPKDGKKSIKDALFNFPEDKCLRKKWAEMIPFKDLPQIKISAICILHFEDNVIQNDPNKKDGKDGEVDQSEYPKLLPDAFPTKFEDLTYAVPASETGAEQEQQNVQEKPAEVAYIEDEPIQAEAIKTEAIETKAIKTEPKENSLHENLCARNRLRNQEVFLEKYKEMLNLTNWDVRFIDDDIYIFKLRGDVENGLIFVETCLRLNKNLVIKITHYNQEEPRFAFWHILPQSYQVTLWSQLQKIMALYDPKPRESKNSS